MLHNIPLVWNEALSGIFGSISLAAWIFLLVPQLIENYRQGSADGISMTFLLIWAAGDVFNLAGALWAGLVPTATALAVYFCFADSALIAQCVYYNTLNARKDAAAAAAAEAAASTANGAPTEAAEDSPLLTSNNRKPSSSHAHRRRSTASSHLTRRDSLTRFLEEPTPTSAYLKNTISVLAIIVAGAAGWALAYKTGAWRPQPVVGSGDEEHTATPLGASILGYASAVLYLGARVPQIIKNQRERSCEGLSLLFFLLSLMGNATYGAGILFHSLDDEYVLVNTPWLIGSLGTMVEDVIIFWQFRVFGEKKEEAEAVEA